MRFQCGKILWKIFAWVSWSSWGCFGSGIGGDCPRQFRQFADTLEELKDATIPAEGATVKETKSAVKTVVEVPAPSGKDRTQP